MLDLMKILNGKSKRDSLLCNQRKIKKRNKLPTRKEEKRTKRKLKKPKKEKLRNSRFLLTFKFFLIRLKFYLQTL